MAGAATKNYLRMHHPSVYKQMYAKGGKVKYYQRGGKNTDTVPAMLTPGEVVLNADQQSGLEKITGMKTEALMKQIGVPGFKGGGKAELLPGKTKEEYASAFKLDPATVSVDTLGHTPTSYDFRIKGTGLSGKEKSYRDTAIGVQNLRVGTGQDVYTPTPWMAQYDSLRATGKYSDIVKAVKLKEENTKGMTDEEVVKMMFTRKAGGGKISKKDALMKQVGVPGFQAGGEVSDPYILGKKLEEQQRQRFTEGKAREAAELEARKKAALTPQETWDIKTEDEKTLSRRASRDYKANLKRKNFNIQDIVRSIEALQQAKNLSTFPGAEKYVEHREREIPGLVKMAMKSEHPLEYQEGGKVKKKKKKKKKVLSRYYN